MTTMVLSLLAGGCATHSPPKVDETRVRQFAGRGYLGDDHFSIVTSFANWNADGYSFDLAWTLPVSGGALPVVVYLPGLGESRSAGESWRTAWAQAGYAVLSLQALPEDQKAWSSESSRRGDFALLARERYASEVTASRLKALAAMLGELHKEHAADQVLLRRLDLSRIAIAGFDLGAHTSMLLAGELPQASSEPLHLPVSIAAVIALSPHASFSGSAFGARYRSVTGPVLSVSSDADSDPLGLVSPPSLRKAPFEYMPSHDAYLLWLSGTPHSVFSGSRIEAVEESIESGVSRRGQGATRSGAKRSGGRRSAGSFGAAAGDEGPMDSGGGKSIGAAPGSATERALAVSLIQGVTTAFLDAYLKHDPFAQEWLRLDARRWIGDRGELKRR
jgi:dienelactone hydrolase